MVFVLSVLNREIPGIILCDSVLNRVHNFVRVCPNYSLDENCSYFKYLKAMTITRICSIMFAKKWL